MFDFLAQERALTSCLSAELTVPSPFDARTEWERYHESEGEPVYRMLFRKIREPEGPVPEPEFRDTNPKRVHADGTPVAAIDPAFRLGSPARAAPDEPSER